MAAVPAADQPVPEDEADEEEEEEPFDPWAAAGQQAGDAPSPTDAAEYRQFLQFLNRRGGARRGRAEGDDEDDDDKDSRSNAGPPPTWDGTTPFRDYLISHRPSPSILHVVEGNSAKIAKQHRTSALRLRLRRRQPQSSP